MNDSLITNDTNFDFTAIPENLKLNLMALANLENSIGESYATIAKQIISEFPNISDDDANSLITALFLYYVLFYQFCNIQNLNIIFFFF